jgi:hypothetical protein
LRGTSSWIDTHGIPGSAEFGSGIVAEIDVLAASSSDPHAASIARRTACDRIIEDASLWGDES